MKKLNNRVINYYLIPFCIFLFSIFVNRSFTLESHSLGLNLQKYSTIFPLSDGILQPQRILLPVLGRVLNINLQLINLFFLIIFLGCFYNYLLKSQSRTNAILITLGISASMVIQFHLNFGGYPDILSYLLLLIAYIYKRKNITPYVVLFFALITKETVAFTFLFFLLLKEISKLKLLLSFIFYIPIYIYFSNGELDLNYYLNPLSSDIFFWFSQSSNYFLLGAFSSIKFLWALLIIYILTNFKKSLPIFALLVGIGIQFFFGADSTRLFSFIFLGLLYVFDNLKNKQFKIFYTCIFFLNVLTKKYYVFFGELLIINQSMLSPVDIYELITLFSLD